MNRIIGLALQALVLPALMLSHSFGEEHGTGKEPHEEEREERLVLNPEAVRAAGIQLAPAGPAIIRITKDFPGEIALNSDRLSHIVPRVPGIVREVLKNLGDTVRSGDLMAVLESRELANAKTEYLAASERLKLAQANFEREEDLWKQKVSAQKDYLEAKQQLAEARIQVRSSEQKLRAIGLTRRDIERLPAQGSEDFTHFEVRAPFPGTVIEKHASLGEVIREDTQTFLLADLSTVWANVTIYAKDLALVKTGQEVFIHTEGSAEQTTGTLTFIGPIVGEKTRASTARAVLPNDHGAWKPGMFVTARVVQSKLEVPIAVPEEAVQIVEGKPTVFIGEKDAFHPRPIVRGRSDGLSVEVLGGLAAGEPVVVKNSFLLKAELAKGEAGHDH